MYCLPPVATRGFYALVELFSTWFVAAGLFPHFSAVYFIFRFLGEVSEQFSEFGNWFVVRLDEIIHKFGLCSNNGSGKSFQSPAHAVPFEKVIR